MHQDAVWGQALLHKLGWSVTFHPLVLGWELEALDADGQRMMMLKGVNIHDCLRQAGKRLQVRHIKANPPKPKGEEDKNA